MAQQVHVAPAEAEVCYVSVGARDLCQKGQRVTPERVQNSQRHVRPGARGR